MTTVLQRINEAARILQENPWIKSMENSAYKSVDIDQIRREVGAAEAQAGLVVQYQETAFDTIASNGKSFCRVSAILTYYSIDDENMEQGLEFPRTGIAQDPGDKGWNKAETMLYKNHYKGLYHIGERVEDPDSLSNEEVEVLEYMRCYAKYNNKRREDYLPQFDDLMDMVRKAKPHMDELAEKERKAAKQAKLAQADDFFKSSKKEEEIRTKAKTIRPKLNAYAREHLDDPRLKTWVEQYGTMDKWPDTIMVRAWEEDFGKEARE